VDHVVRRQAAMVATAMGSCVLERGSAVYGWTRLTQRMQD